MFMSVVCACKCIRIYGIKLHQANLTGWLFDSFFNFFFLLLCTAKKAFMFFRIAFTVSAKIPKSDWLSSRTLDGVAGVQQLVPILFVCFQLIRLCSRRMIPTNISKNNKLIYFRHFFCYLSIH